MTRPLHLIFVSDKRVRDYYCITADGDAETCNPQTLVETFPDIIQSYAIVDESEMKRPSNRGTPHSDIVTATIQDADLCILDSTELEIYTRREDLFQQLMTRLLSCLPEKES